MELINAFKSIFNDNTILTLQTNNDTFCTQVGVLHLPFIKNTHENMSYAVAKVSQIIQRK